MWGVATIVVARAASAARARESAAAVSSGPSSRPGRTWTCRSIIARAATVPRADDHHVGRVPRERRPSSPLTPAPGSRRGSAEEGELPIPGAEVHADQTVAARLEMLDGAVDRWWR